MDLTKLNLLGAWVAIIIMLSCILIFIFRLTHRPNAEYYTGVVFMLTAIPIIFLFFSSFNFNRPSLYHIQLGLMIAFIILELLLFLLMAALAFIQRAKTGL